MKTSMLCCCGFTPHEVNFQNKSTEHQQELVLFVNRWICCRVVTTIEDTRPCGLPYKCSFPFFTQWYNSLRRGDECCVLFLYLFVVSSVYTMIIHPESKYYRGSNKYAKTCGGMLKRLLCWTDILLNSRCPWRPSGCFEGSEVQTEEAREVSVVV